MKQEMFTQNFFFFFQQAAGEIRFWNKEKEKERNKQNKTFSFWDWLV